LKLRFKTLQGLLSFILASTAVGLAIIAGVFFYSLEFGHSQASSEQNVRDLMATVKTTASVAAFSGNGQIAHDVINGLLKNAVVGRVEITGTNKLHLSNSRGDNVKLGNPIAENIVSPFDSSEIVGVLRVEPDADRISTAARQSAFQLVVWVIGVILITAAIAIMVIRQTVSRPVSRVVDQMKDIVPESPMRLTMAAHLDGNELGVLVNGFNNVLDAMSRVIHEERFLREQFEKMEQRMRQIFDSSTAGIVVADAMGFISVTNPAFLKLADINPDATPIESLQIFELVDKFFADPEAIRNLVNSTKPGTNSGGDFAVRAGVSSHVCWVHLDIFIEGFGDYVSRVQYVIYDISDRKCAEEMAQYEAHHDHLTALPNRRNAEMKIEQLLRHAELNKQRAALILIDLDGFKQINDTMGHDAGDLVLVEVARRLKNSVRAVDLVSRLGGDEFLVVLPNAHSDKNVRLVALKLITTIAVPIKLTNDTEGLVGASLGIAIYPENGFDRETLTDAADAAMYVTKRMGKNGYTFAGQDYANAATT